MAFNFSAPYLGPETLCLLAGSGCKEEASDDTMICQRLRNCQAPHTFSIPNLFFRRTTTPTEERWSARRFLWVSLEYKVFAHGLPKYSYIP